MRPLKKSNGKLWGMQFASKHLQFSLRVHFLYSCIVCLSAIQQTHTWLHKFLSVALPNITDCRNEMEREKKVWTEKLYSESFYFPSEKKPFPIFFPTNCILCLAFWTCFFVCVSCTTQSTHLLETSCETTYYVWRTRCVLYNKEGKCFSQKTNKNA